MIMAGEVEELRPKKIKLATATYLSHVEYLPGWTRVISYRPPSDKVQTRSHDTFYYSPFPYLHKYRSMKAMMYFHRDVDWRHFHYASGLVRPGYESPAYRANRDDEMWFEPALHRT